MLVARQKFQEHARSASEVPRTCYSSLQKFQEHVIVACQKFQEHVRNVASRACHMFQKHVSCVSEDPRTC